ncbi:MAG: hypothetical protein AB7S44_00030 [Spirochaetales bacterium]
MTKEEKQIKKELAKLKAEFQATINDIFDNYVKYGDEIQQKIKNALIPLKELNSSLESVDTKSKLQEWWDKCFGNK